MIKGFFHKRDFGPPPYFCMIKSFVFVFTGLLGKTLNKYGIVFRMTLIYKVII